MANVVARRLLNRNIFKLKEFIHFPKPNRCASVLLLNFDNSALFTNSHEFERYSCLKNSQIRLYSDQCKPKEDDKEKKQTIFQKFKQMYKDYWYVLVPVHLVTSAAWFGGFYYLAKSGVDIPTLLETMHISEKITNSLRDSSMGYLAVAYALYKIATPARYTVTLGGTTISINYLKKWGYIKPVPSKERLKEIYLEKKDNLLESMRDTREGLKMQSEKLKDRKDNIMDDFDSSIKQIKELGDKIKSTGVKKKSEKVTKE